MATRKRKTASEKMRKKLQDKVELLSKTKSLRNVSKTLKIPFSTVQRWHASRRLTPTPDSLQNAGISTHKESGVGVKRREACHL